MRAQAWSTPAKNLTEQNLLGRRRHDYSVALAPFFAVTFLLRLPSLRLTNALTIAFVIRPSFALPLTRPTVGTPSNTGHWSLVIAHSLWQSLAR
jgi:hypothetical protein